MVRGRTADNQPFLAIPFYALANREKSAQEVWIAQRGIKPIATWWLGSLYRPLGKAGSPDEPPPPSAVI